LKAKTKPSVRLAIIGCGLIGKRHAEAIMGSNGAELIAFVDPYIDTEPMVAGRRIPLFADLDQLFNVSRPDGVIIASPTKLHVSQARQCLSAGVPMLIEKPISDDLEEAWSLVAESQNLDVAMLVGHHRRFNPLIHKAHQFITDGHIGNIRGLNVICWFYKPDEYFNVAPWRKKMGAGPISVNLIHDIDLMRYFCGEVVSVQAQAVESIRGYENEDLASALLRFANGALGTLSVSDSIVAPWSWEFTSSENSVYPCTHQSCYFIGGSEGALSIPDMRFWSHEGQNDWWNPMSSVPLQYNVSDPLINQINHFIRVIVGEEEPLVSGLEGTKSLEVIDAIQKAAKNQQVIELNKHLKREET
jgi:predicted dehydrogenase